MYLFTFQYGSIQIKCYINNRLAIAGFTFQYGSIQILRSNHRLYTHCVIYIPIWFYSNQRIILDKFALFDIYIPIWFYSNSRSLALSLALYYLHSNMVLFKSELSQSELAALSFTFQYGSIQILITSFLFFVTVIFTFQYGSIQIGCWL